MFVLSITLPNLSIPDVPFPALLSTPIRRRFQVKPATLLIPNDLILFLTVVPVPKWPLFLNLCGECFFFACVVIPFSSKSGKEVACGLLSQIHVVR